MAARTRLERTALALEHWPNVDPQALTPEARRVFLQREACVKAFAGGARATDSLVEGVDRKTLSRMLSRARQPHQDGRVWGWRALVPNARVKVYERSSRPRVLVNTKAGNAGAFAQLLSRFPELKRSCVTS